MKQKLQLQIPEPCHENWNNMTETQQGRFCISCQKEVVDFSVMSDKEILGYISTASSNICGRVHDNQLNRYIQAPIERKKYPFKYFWSVLIASALIANESSGQILPPKDTTVNLAAIQPPVVIRMGAIAAPQKKDQLNWVINGRIVDENGDPVPYASVIIKGTKEGAVTDDAGAFSLKTKHNSGQIELLVSSVGFMQKIVALNNPSAIKSLVIEGRTMKMEVAIEPLKKNMMGEVVVTVDPTRKGKMTVGLMSAVVRYTVLDSIKNMLPGSQIKVYPNPIAINSIFKLSFNVKELGEYALQFTDASGKIISSSVLNIVSKNHVQSFNSNMLSGHGFYFVSITNRKTMKMFTNKLIVQ